MKIPIYQQQVLPSLETGVSQSLPGERKRAIIGEYVPDTTGQAISNVLMDIGQKMFHAEAIEQYNDAETAYRKGVTDLLQDMKMNSEEWGNLTIKEHEEKFRDKYERLRDNIEGNINNNVAKKSFKNFSAGQEIDAYAKVKQQAYVRTIDRGKAKLSQDIDDLVNVGVRNDDATTITTAMSKIEGAKAAGFLSATEAQAMAEQTRSNFGITYSNKLIASDPLHAYEILSNEEKAPAFFKELDEGERLKVLHNSITALSAHVAKQERAETLIEKQRTRVKKENDSKAIQAYYEGSLTVADLDNAHRKMDISDGVYERIRGKLTGGAGIKNNPVVVGEMSEKFARGGDIDKDLDLAYSNHQISTSTYISMKGKQGNREYKAGLNYINTLLVVPPSIKGTDAALPYLTKKQEAIDRYNERMQIEGMDSMEAAKWATDETLRRQEEMQRGYDILNKNFSTSKDPREQLTRLAEQWQKMPAGIEKEKMKQQILELRRNMSMLTDEQYKMITTPFIVKGEQ